MQEDLEYEMVKHLMIEYVHLKCLKLGISCKNDKQECPLNN
jgi:hypothetical protein